MFMVGIMPCYRRDLQKRFRIALCTAMAIVVLPSTVVIDTQKEGYQMPKEPPLNFVLQFTTQDTVQEQRHTQ